MAKDLKFGACLPVFASCADRFVLSGYGGGGETVEEMLDLATKVPTLSGVELVGNWHINDENIKQMKKLLGDRNLDACRKWSGLSRPIFLKFKIQSRMGEFQELLCRDRCVSPTGFYPKG